ncbi:hypothetical protein ACFS5L_35620 [Streptomyces phyllanthi]|uniref:Cysteinyl-tRNA synthetase n=1 Tax=Streptomyces phyllanthi TaxID=1803180 RepID=A0A5N8W4H7_9ACTN|nr:hypothetical protein [Streptomyces phyllanthi]MPY42219.1 hypothetical protein [Streptomyces phyllanthi]
MLRITDARTGAPTEVRRALTRVHAHVTGADASALRVLLVADLLARVLELGGVPALTVADPSPPLRERADALGVRPAEAAAPVTGPTLHVAGPGTATPEDGVHVRVAPADDSGPPADGSVLRLALLTVPRTEPADPGAVADEARDTLARWRKAVAGWATRPSRPVPDAVRHDLRTAWEDDLDVPAVLDVLRRVEDAEDLPDGARFETYAYADRLLGLHLTRDIGAAP